MVLKTFKRAARCLPLLVAPLALAGAAPVRGNDHEPPAVALERPAYGAIALKSPSLPGGEARPGGLPLRPTGQSRDSDAPPAAIPGTAARSSTLPLVTIGSSLAVVLGLFAALVWVSKKTGHAGGRGGVVPDEALRLLGQKSLGAAGSVALLRCGRSVLVVGISAAGMQPLSEITDDEEVRHLEAICKGESAASFQAALNEMQREPAGRGFVAEEPATPRARKKLFSDR